MKLNEARLAIEAILAAIDADELPKPSKVEKEDGQTIAWFGGHGYYLGSTRNGFGEHIPGGSHRRTGAWDAVTQEAVYRLDLDSPKAETHTERKAREASGVAR